MIGQWAKRLAEAVAPDEQTIILLRSGAHGAANMGRGLRASWDAWTARRGAAGDTDQPPAFPCIDLTAADPIAAIVSAPEFVALNRFSTTYWLSTPRLIDFSRTSPLRPF